MLQTDTLSESGPGTLGWRIYGLPVDIDAADHDWDETAERAEAAGFDTLCLPLEAVADPSVLQRCSRAAMSAGLRLLLDCPTSTQTPGPSVLDAVSASGVTAALLLRDLAAVAPQVWQDRLHGLRARHAELALTIWTPGMKPEQVAALQGLPIDGVYSSLPWWNFRNDWLIEEYDRLRAVAPVIAPLADPRAAETAAPSAAETLCRLAAATMAGEALLVTERQVRQLDAAVLEALLRDGQRGNRVGDLRRLTGPLSALTALFRHNHAGRLLLLNPADHPAVLDRGMVERRLPRGFVLQDGGTDHADPLELPAYGWAFLPLAGADSIASYGTTSRQQRGSLVRAMRNARIAIELVRPQIDDGLFAVKRSLGERVRVSATIFMDGHEQLAAELLWRPVDEPEWRSVAMRPLGNDVWEAGFLPARLGRYPGNFTKRNRRIPLSPHKIEVRNKISGR